MTILKNFIPHLNTVEQHDDQKQEDPPDGHKQEDPPYDGHKQEDPPYDDHKHEYNGPINNFYIANLDKDTYNKLINHAKKCPTKK